MYQQAQDGIIILIDKILSEFISEHNRLKSQYSMSDLSVDITEDWRHVVLLEVSSGPVDRNYPNIFRPH